MTSTYGQRPAAPPEFNPLSESALLDPASMYDQIRTERPVFWHEQLGTWVVHPPRRRRHSTDGLEDVLLHR